jgi:hypothetical protein
MTETFLDSIQFQPDYENLIKRLRLRPGSPMLEDFSAFFDEIVEIARPKVYYKVAFTDENDSNSVVIDGIRFESRVLCVNLAEVHRIFAYLATCGVELEAHRAGETDILRQYWADAVMEAALQAAMLALREDMSLRYQVGKTSGMNPGSLPDWPISQQKPFFELLGETANRTGVRLTESMLMVPAKSTTGLFFETESDFVNCQLCPRKSCPNRRAGYDQDLYEARYDNPG